MKKMRRMIPALCMLLVSAIMLSTASYAWFTMNNEVEATGMQVQAKSTGSLVVGTEPLQYDDAGTTADFSSENTAISVKPITWKDGAWKIVEGDVDTFAGTMLDDAALVAITPATSAGYFVDRVVYIGSAGDTLYNQSLTINLSAVVEAGREVTKAYSAAIYVIEPDEDYYDSTLPIFVPDENGDPTEAALAPDAIVHVDSYKDTTYTLGRNQWVLEGAEDEENEGYHLGYTIPSIVGIEGNKTTGLKVVIRIFVDGDLDAYSADNTPATKDQPVVSYTPASGKFDPNVTYYADADGSRMANTTGYTTADDVPTGWYIRNTEGTTPVRYKYVNSDDVPMTSSTLQILFRSAELEQAPVEEPEDQGN